MNIYSIQLSQYRKLPENLVLFDMTAKELNNFFSPTWDLVLKLKQKKISEEIFTRKYLELLNQRKIKHPEKYKEIFNLNNHAFSCVCNKDTFCHRFLAIKWLENECRLNNTDFNYLGEIS